MLSHSRGRGVLRGRLSPIHPFIIDASWRCRISAKGFVLVIRTYSAPVFVMLFPSSKCTLLLMLLLLLLLSMF